MELDLAIRGGTVVTASDTSAATWASGASASSRWGRTFAPSARSMPAGLLVLPGGIDSHVHIAQPSGPGDR